MATTSNYGWTTPDDSSLVKDGASAIRALGTAIDTSMNTALGTKKAGLVLLNTTSFSAVASQSVNDVFSSTYDNYRIVIETTASSGNYLNFKLRVSGADDSSANYTWGMVNTTNGAAAFQLAGTNATTGFNVLRPGTSRNSCSFDIYSPNIARATMYTGTQSYNDGATVSIAGAIGGNHSVNTAYTGFTLIHAGTITGTVSVYGYNK